MSGGARLQGLDPGQRVFSRGGAAGTLLDGRGRVLGGGVAVALVVVVLGVRYVERDGAIAQPASVCRVEAVAAAPRPRGPHVAAAAAGPATLLGAAEHQPEGWAGRGLAERLLSRQNHFLQVEPVLHSEMEWHWLHILGR